MAISLILNDHEWLGRRQNFEVHVLSRTTQENLIGKVNVIATKLEVAELTSRDACVYTQSALEKK